MRFFPRQDRDGEEGAILVLAILVITVIALVTGAVLTRGEGSLQATVALRDVARTSYAADSATQVAINALRTGHNVGSGEPSPWYYTNGVGTGCFGYDGAGGATTPRDTLTLDNVVPKGATDTQTAMSATVVCEPEDATGEQGSAVPINNANKPGNAILTLGTGGAENGFTFKTNGSGAAFRVRGGIWVNSNIVRDNNGNLESTESIRAVTGCSPANAMVAPTVNCSASTAADPGYPSEIALAGTGVPALRTPPASCPVGGTVELDPGYYDDAALLNALTNTNSQCFVHFNPGAYYFDFHNDSAVGDPYFDADVAGNTGNTWTIAGRKTVVAGTLTGDGVPGACVNPIDDVGAQGVQFIFGATSRLAINASGQDTQVEICGSYSATRPPIAIYGQKTGTATSTTRAGGTALTASAVPAVTTGTFTGATVANLGGEDGNQATNANLAWWTRDNTGVTGAQPGSITLTGFSPGTNLPKGTVLTGARLRVTHRAYVVSGGGAQPQNSVTLTPAVGTAPISYTLPVRTTLGTEDIDLSARTGWGALQKAVHDGGFSGATVKFDAALRRNQAAQLDAVRLELTYWVPQLRAQTGTVATPAGTPVIQVSGNSTTYYVQGTTYTPLSSIDLALNNLDESVFRFGVIARALAVFETGSFSYPGAVIELPENSPGFGFERTLVRLKVYVCPGTSGCAVAAGNLALESRVELFDDGGTPGPPHRQVTVLNWSHPR